MKHFGTPDLSVRADTLMYGVFRRDNGDRTYCTYNGTGEGKLVTFSDGFKLQAVPGNLTCD